MPEFQKQIRGIDQRSVNFAGPQQATTSVAEALAPQAEVLLKGMASGYAQGTGENLAGADEEGVNGLDGLVAGAFAEHREALDNTESTPESVKGVYDEAVSSTLNTQKRIQAAIDQGVMSSAAGNARMQALRKEKLSNPIVSMFQSDFDKSFSSMTGAGARGAYFGQTPEELKQAEVQKQQNTAYAQKEVALDNLVQSGAAVNRKVAEGMYNNHQANAAELKHLTTKDSLGKLGGGEAAKKYDLESIDTQAQLASMAIQFADSEGTVEQKKAYMTTLLQSREQEKFRIESSGMTRPNKDAALARINAQYDHMETIPDDVSLTKHMEAATKQVQSILQNEGMTTIVNAMKASPQLAAAYTLAGGNPQAMAPMLELIFNNKSLAAEFANATSPVATVINSLTEVGKQDVMVDVVDAAQGGAGKLSPITAEAFGLSMTAKGIPNQMSLAFTANPESVLANIEQAKGIRLQPIGRNKEWKGIANRQPALIDALITKAARSAMLLTMGAPTTVSVKQEYAPVGNTVRPQSWNIDTGGFEVKDLYKEQIVAAYRMATNNPKIWEKGFESVDEYLSSKFTLPSGNVEPMPVVAVEETPVEAPKSTKPTAEAVQAAFEEMNPHLFKDKKILKALKEVDLNAFEDFDGDGEYELEDGSRFYVKNGKVVE